MVGDAGGYDPSIHTTDRRGNVMALKGERRT